MSRALALVDPSDESRKKHEIAGTTSVPPLLETKLYPPRARSGLVARPRLADAVRHGVEHKLTIVVAPAGFGKTTLLAGWLADSEESEKTAGWVSLDPSDNEPRAFWAYVISALQTLHPTVGTHAISLLQSPHPPSVESVLTALINEIDQIDRDFILILDDYHVIDAPAIHGAMTFLLDHMPRRLRLVITSRAEPPLALPRLRARGELAELRVADMRFTLDEASTFLNQVMTLELSASDTAVLEERTEGWITGLKLAAFSLKANDDRHRFVTAFSGDNRFIADYLVEEVLRSEPANVQRFLRGTAMLHRLSGPLCDAVLGETGSQALLEDLERRNLFVVALDDRREWFRYHHLFADVLERQSAARDPDAARAFHRRASAWYETHGSHAGAVCHALAAEDVERAAGLLETAWPEKNRSYESRKWLERVKSLPDDVVRARPLLSMGYAWALLNSGELEAAEPRLRDVERSLESVRDDASTASLRKELASARVYLSQSVGEVPGTLEHARRALDLVPETDIAARATGTALLALAYWGRGDLDVAHQTFSSALELMRQSGHEVDVVRGIFVLGDIRVSQGRLRDAASTYERGLRVAKEGTYPSPPETDELYLGLSEVHREWNDLGAAASYLEAMTQAAASTAHKGNRLRWCTASASIRSAQGDMEAALELLDEAERSERRDPLPRLRPVPAMKARIRISQGSVDDAAGWARAAKLTPNDDLSYLREFEHVTLARVLVATDAASADRLLERLAVAARTGRRMGNLIEILVLRSLAQQARGNSRAALDTLSEALALAEPEGYLRVFLDEGTRMRDLLRQATARGLAGDYSRRVLAAYDVPRQPEALPPESNGASPVQSLTTRELEILRLIAGGLRNQEIADTLSISAATVKRHIANAYGKLGAGHRTEALARAKELKLL